MNETSFTVGIFSLFVLFILAQVLWKWTYSWKGVLKDKIIQEERGVGIDDSDYSPWCTQRFILIFKTSEGEIIKKKVSREKFDKTNVGDKYEKTRGSWRARKI